MTGRCRLLALDLDGTLLRDDGTIAPVDAAAIARARGAGIAVTLATGRWPQLTLPFAHALALDTPLVCADGALTIAPHTGEVTAAVTLPVGLRAPLVRLAADAGLPLLGLTSDRVLGRAADRALAEQLAGFTPHFTAVAALEQLGEAALPLLAGFVLGERAAIVALDASAAAAALRADGATLDAFPLVDGWALRVRPADVDKRLAVATLAAARGLEAAACGAVGDWYNDLGLLAWAGFSFAMGHAPVAVVKAARHHLRATALRGGGVAEAIDILLGRG